MLYKKLFDISVNFSFDKLKFLGFFLCFAFFLFKFVIYLLIFFLGWGGYIDVKQTDTCFERNSTKISEKNLCTQYLFIVGGSTEQNVTTNTGVFYIIKKQFLDKLNSWL